MLRLLMILALIGLLVGLTAGAIYLGQIINEPLNFSPAFTYRRPPKLSSEEATKTAKVKTILPGFVSGRICYPSEGLPAGQIVAKQVDTNKVYSQNYPGSLNGGGSDYEMELTPGNYVLRYEVKGEGKSNFYGYHTTVCQTGLEVSCGDTKMRQLVIAEVQPATHLDNHDLCDFYYQPDSAPKF